jgi:hypothetical protein
MVPQQFVQAVLGLRPLLDQPAASACGAAELLENLLGGDLPAGLHVQQVQGDRVAVQAVGLGVFQQRLGEVLHGSGVEHVYFQGTAALRPRTQRTAARSEPVMARESPIGRHRCLRCQMQKEQNALERVYEPGRLLERRPARLATAEE